MNTTLSLIGLLIAAVLFIVVIWKGLDTFTSTILVSLIVIFTSGLDWWQGLQSYISGYTGFLGSQIFVLVIGSVFGELMGSSGCAESIANVITEKLGVKNVILSIVVITTIFVYVGVSGFVVLFVLAPIATVMMKQAGYPYKMIPGIIFIGATCSAMIPYAINVTNTIPASFLGTSLGSAPELGWIAFAVSTAVGYFYMVYAANKEAKKDGTALDPNVKVTIKPTRDDLPNFWVALIPFVLVVALVLVLTNVVKMADSNEVVVLAMFIGSVVICLLCPKQIKGKLKDILAKGTNNGVGATCMASAIIGFSTVLQSTIGFEAIKNFVLNINLNPYITEFIGLNLLAGIMGSGTAACNTFFQFFTEGLLAKGANAGALHRIAPAAVTGMNTLPNAGGMVAQIKWMNLTLAESYWYVFVTSVLAPMIGSFVAVLVAIAIY